jgi:hypothetical protein
LLTARRFRAAAETGVSGVRLLLFLPDKAEDSANAGAQKCKR